MATIFELPGLVKDKANINAHNGSLAVPGEISKSAERNSSIDVPAVGGRPDSLPGAIPRYA